MIENKDLESAYFVNGVSLPFKGRMTLANKLRERGTMVEPEVKGRLLSDQVLSVYLLADLWQSLSRKHFISMIVTSVDKSFAHNEILLSFCDIGTRHKSKNIVETIFVILKEYGITSKVSR